MIDETDVEPTHSFEVADAIRLGSVEKAIIYKEIKRFSAYKIRHNEDGWVFYSGRSLAEKYPYMSKNSIERWLRELVEAGEFESTIRNKSKYDKTKSYRPRKIGIKTTSSMVENQPSGVDNDETIPPLSSPQTILGGAGTPPRKVLGQKNRLGRYNEAASSDSYEDAIDLDSGEAVAPAKEPKDPAVPQMRQLLSWAEGRRGAKFLHIPKQMKAINAMKSAGISPPEIKNRWIALESDPYWKDKGLDFVIVASSFDKKPHG